MAKEGVVLAILNKEYDKFFMHRRGEKQSQTGDILFISGGVEEGEEYIETIHREVAEELGSDVILLSIISLNINPLPVSKRGTILRGFLIPEYAGELPSQILDTGNETLWVDVHEAAASEVDSVRLIAGAALKVITHLPYHPSSANIV